MSQFMGQDWCSQEEGWMGQSPDASSSLSNSTIPTYAPAVELLQILFMVSLWKWKAYLTTSITTELKKLTASPSLLTLN